MKSLKLKCRRVRRRNLLSIIDLMPQFLQKMTSLREPKLTTSKINMKRKIRKKNNTSRTSMETKVTVPRPWRSIS